jgi:hypothetical protein
MMTSASTSPPRFTEIDDLTRPDHSYLVTADDCYFLGEYTARKGFAFSATNSLILNFKKKMDRRGRAEWAYKSAAIQNAAALLRAAFDERARQDLTFVPVPPSKAKDDPLYDDRLVRMLHAIWPGHPADIRELVVQPVSSDAVHDQETRPSPSELEARYVLDQTLLHPAAETIAIVDDVITTGAHFVAVRNKVREAFPMTKIVGLFIARRVPEAVDFSDFDDLL